MITKELLIELLNSRYRWDIIDLFMDTQEKINTVNSIWSSCNKEYPLNYFTSLAFSASGATVLFAGFTLLKVIHIMSKPEFKSGFIMAAVLGDRSGMSGEEMARVIEERFLKFKREFLITGATSLIKRLTPVNIAFYEILCPVKSINFQEAFNDKIANFIMLHINAETVSLEFIEFIQKLLV